MYFEFIFLCYFINISFALLNGWHYLNIHCRDNDDAPVDWWYIIKPPGPAAPYEESGRNFSFITSTEVQARWKLGDRLITSDNMLFFTLNPMFKATFVDHLAYLVFEASPAEDNNPGSNTRAVLMADAIGGLLVIHSVPNMVDTTSDRFTFPEEEIKMGHLVACVSLDHYPLNDLAKIIWSTGSTLKSAHVPKFFETVLPYWKHLQTNALYPSAPFGDVQLVHDEDALSKFEFISESQLIHGVLLSRRPGITTDLYETFAKSNDIVLDVYSPVTYARRSRNNRPGFCLPRFGVRNIALISIKTHDWVEYIRPSFDMSRFAVSTAAHWQQQGLKKEQYWICIGNLLKDDPTPLGGLIYCAENNQAWFVFDNLKVKEPDCILNGTRRNMMLN